MSKLKDIIQSFQKLQVLIIGDVMIDAYVFGKVHRISPEAPVPVVAVSAKENRLGGAANVALNVQAMGATPVLCSVIGNDNDGKELLRLLKKQKLSAQGIVQSKARITTSKTRIIGNNHQMLRVDEEIETELSAADEKNFIQRIRQLLNDSKIDAIIFEDYDKGVITKELIKQVVELAGKKKIPTVVDPKKRHFLHYQGVSLFKPNLKELREGLKSDLDPSVKKAFTNSIGSFLKKQKIGAALITLSEKGIYMHTQKEQHHIPAHVRTISDVSGAGDTVVSIAALCLAAGLSPKNTAQLSNLAGGLVCEKIGVVPIDKKQLLEEAETLKLID